MASGGALKTMPATGGAPLSENGDSRFKKARSAAWKKGAIFRNGNAGSLLARIRAATWRESMTSPPNTSRLTGGGTSMPCFRAAGASVRFGAPPPPQPMRLIMASAAINPRIFLADPRRRGLVEEPGHLPLMVPRQLRRRFQQRLRRTPNCLQRRGLIRSGHQHQRVTRPL